MFEAALESVIEALERRIRFSSPWRASRASLSGLIDAKAVSSVSSPSVMRLEKVPDLAVPGEAGQSAPPVNANLAQSFSGLPEPSQKVSREERLQRLEALEDKISRCAACGELAASRTQPVRAGGNVDADVVFVEEVPSETQDAEGHPGAGEASELLDKMLKAMHLDREQVYVVNVLRCRPPSLPGDSQSRKPSASELEACGVYLRELVCILQPKVIVALGASAARGLLGLNEPVARLRSHWREFQGIPVMPTFHPRYLIENPDLENKRKVWEDLLLVMERLKLPISSKQRGYFLR